MSFLKPILFSAVQPTGQLTIGNYIGTLSHWSDFQDRYQCIFSIADLHSMTVLQDSKKLKKSQLDTIAFYLSVGVDPKKSIVFLQSSVSEHCKLYWVLSCYTYFGELIRMTQFKNKSKIHSNNVNSGLFTYPILMASDILLYHSEYVLIGNDQKQHLELVRNLVKRFNFLYGDIFKMPNICIPQKNNSKVMSLLCPTCKMSKSDANPNNVIFLLEDSKSIFKKIQRSVTDSEQKILYDVNKKAGISNLLNIYSNFTGKSILELEEKFLHTSYKDFKYLVAKVISKTLLKIQEKFYYFRSNEHYLNEILKEGSYRAQYYAKNIINQVYHVLGL
ncbi:tryptophan--tRNA ligase [Buchnera aphidicola]|uniref:tryptophan--tRNA ligase n=1 Tax=Buchnera aphidicola TaxID=9 RepID=UPI0034638B9C